MSVVPQRGFGKWHALTAASCLILALGVRGYWKANYPYGSSHCCSKLLGLALHMYAREHNGFFPAGGPTPEASLSFLYTNGLSAMVLRGKTVPLKVTQAALVKDGVLGPESCGWHYVEGLKDMDDPNIAIVWDKVGLNHNGRRFKGGGHEVIRLDGSTHYVSGPVRPKFLEDQKQLLATRATNVQTKEIEGSGPPKPNKQ